MTFFILVYTTQGTDFFVYSPLIKSILTIDYSFLLPFSKSPLPPLSQDPLISISLQKRTNLLGMSTEHGIMRFNETRHKLGYINWNNPVTQKEPYEQEKESETSIPTPTFRSSSETPS